MSGPHDHSWLQGSLEKPGIWQRGLAQIPAARNRPVPTFVELRARTHNDKKECPNLANRHLQTTWKIRWEFRILQLLRVSGQDVAPGSLPLFLLYPALVPSCPTLGLPHIQALSAHLLQTAALLPLLKPRNVGSGCTVRRVGQGTDLLQQAGGGLGAVWTGNIEVPGTHSVG